MNEGSDRSSDELLQARSHLVVRQGITYYDTIKVEKTMLKLINDYLIMLTQTRPRPHNNYPEI